MKEIRFTIEDEAWDKYQEIKESFPHITHRGIYEEGIAYNYTLIVLDAEGGTK